MLVFLRVYKLVSDFNCQEMYLSHYILFIAADSDLWRRFLMRRNWLLLFFREKKLGYSAGQNGADPADPMGLSSMRNLAVHVLGRVRYMLHQCS